MIVSRLEGGLGNQMFQYAAARRLSEKHLTSLKLDLTWFQTQTLRQYKLRYFNIWEHLATAQEITALIGQSTFQERLAAKIGRKLGFKQLTESFYQKGVVLKEKNFSFDSDFLNTSFQVYMEGFWQSEKYFLDIADILRQEFTLKYPQSLVFQQISELISNNFSVSLHIRRGDYVQNQDANLFHGTCNLDYYKCAIEYICDRISQPYFFVFSDDPVWVVENLNINFSMHLVSQNNSFHDYEELDLMRQCKHHIIANSSFSWWAAWLNSKADKIVVTPKRWFMSDEYDTKDLIPDTWIRL